MTATAIPPILTSILLSPEALALLGKVLRSDEVESLAKRLHVPKVVEVVSAVLTSLEVDGVMGNAIDTDPASILQTQLAEIRTLIDTPEYNPFAIPGTTSAVALGMLPQRTEPALAEPRLNFVVRTQPLAVDSEYVLIDGHVSTTSFDKAYAAAMVMPHDANPIIDIVDTDSTVHATVTFK